MATCKICKADQVRLVRDFGSRPMCNRYVTDPDAQEFSHPLILGQCESCGLIQLRDPVPPDELAPRVEWLRYNEPEEHLDGLADVLCSLENLPEGPRACGITYKDDSLLERLVARGYRDTWRIDPMTDLDIAVHGVAGETVIPRLTPDRARDLANRYGRVDVIVARHAFEHAHEPLLLFEALQCLLQPGGHIVFEVPDCSGQLSQFDYSMLWEEHMLYFVPATFMWSLRRSSLAVSYFRNFPHPVDAMVAVVTQSDHELDMVGTDSEVRDHLKDGQAFSQAYSETKERLERHLRGISEQGGKIAVFGAGHLSSMFINVMEIGDLVGYVVDDDPHKQSLYMPGSKLPIRPSRSLLEDGIELCLLSMSPQNEAKVIARNGAFIDLGGRFASIFPNRQYTIHSEF